MLGTLVSTESLARQACEIEIDILRKPIGIQDQYIAAYGGLRFMEFDLDGAVHAHKIDLSSDARRALNDRLMLFYTGVSRSSGSILSEQKANIQKREHVLCEMKHIAYTARDSLLAGNFDTIGELLDYSWNLKKQLASQISNGHFDEMYAAARRAGALGGKITGAGGGGFLLLYCPYGRQDAVRQALSGLQELPFQLEGDGSKVIFNYQRQ
jgi:D-glycero-alpha-D-manno-heptose-7-phosphate kinase